MRWVAVAVCAVVVVAGCGAEADSTVAVDEPSWVDVYIEQAVGGTFGSGVPASEQQIEILERARIQGDLTLSDVIESIHNAAACLEEMGLRLTMRAPETSHTGWERPAYSWGGPRSLPPEELAAMGDPCFEAESHYVESAYALQPWAQETAARYFDDRLRAALVACLERVGADFDPEGSQSELHEAAGVIVFGMLDEGYSDQEIAAGGFNCLSEMVPIIEDDANR